MRKKNQIINKLQNFIQNSKNQVSFMYKTYYLYKSSSNYEITFYEIKSDFQVKERHIGMQRCE